MEVRQPQAALARLAVRLPEENARLCASLHRLGSATGAAPDDRLGCAVEAAHDSAIVGLAAGRPDGARRPGLRLRPAIRGILVGSRPPPGRSSGPDAAAAFRAEPPLDAVISFGVFLYFRSLAYAAQVIDRMVKKAERIVTVLDVPDLAMPEGALAYRHTLAGGETAHAEPGSSPLRPARGWLTRSARTAALTSASKTRPSTATAMRRSDATPGDSWRAPSPGTCTA
jgi:hypothetical protein